MMRYSEITRELSSDSMKYIELGGDDYIYARNLREESPSDISTQSGPLLQRTLSSNSYQRYYSPRNSATASQQQLQQQQQHHLYDNLTTTTVTTTPNLNKSGLISSSGGNVANTNTTTTTAATACKRHAKRHSCGNAHTAAATGNGSANGAATISYLSRQRKDSTKSTQSCQLDMVEHLTQSASKAINVKQNNRRKNSIGCLNALSSSPDSPGCYYCVGTPPNGKSQSLPGHASIKNLDAVILSALRVPADELANQITLLDMPIFAAIQPDELTSCAWTKKDKNLITPNIVAFTKRFNHTIFWTVQEILSAEQPKQRAEILTHFIKVAKKLHELNNLHSLFAIISAMQSASIFRLKKTWACISKKDRQSYERLSDIFSDQNNWKKLREYLESLRLPCIPYLGLFLTDLIYIDLAHPHKGGLEPEQRRNKMNNILRVIANYQQSDYSHIQPIDATQNYLTSIRYIEELQNIFEEDQYKKSLKLEPASSSTPSSCSSKESFNVDAVTPALACLNLSPAKTLGSMRIPSGNKFIPGHRKCRSLGSKFRSTSLPRNCHDKCKCTNILMIAPGIGTISNKRCRCNRIFGKVIHTNHDLNGQYIPTNRLQLDVYHQQQQQQLNPNDFLNQLQQSRHLLDDSVLESNQILPATVLTTSSAAATTNCNLQQPLNQLSGHSLAGGIADAYLNGNIEVSPNLHFGDNHFNVAMSAEHCIQGCVRRKTLQKEGRKPTVASWQRYWLQIWANSLVYFPPKSFKGSERSDFKREPCKVCPLDGWYAQISINPKHKNSFELYHRMLGTIYKFRTDSPQATHMWTHSICKVAAQRNAPKPLPVNLMSFE